MAQAAAPVVKAAAAPVAQAAAPVVNAAAPVVKAGAAPLVQAAAQALAPATKTLTPGRMIPAPIIGAAGPVTPTAGPGTPRSARLLAPVARTGSPAIEAPRTFVPLVKVAAEPTRRTTVPAAATHGVSGPMTTGHAAVASVLSKPIHDQQRRPAQLAPAKRATSASSRPAAPAPAPAAPVVPVGAGTAAGTGVAGNGLFVIAMLVAMLAAGLPPLVGRRRLLDELAPPAPFALLLAAPG